MTSLKLTYFPFQGRAEAIRLALYISGIPFEDERISFEEFGKQKTEGRFKYGQLPVISVNGVQYAQQLAILKYVGRITGLYPEDPLEQFLVDQALGSIEEIKDRYKFNKSITNTDYKETDRKLIVEQAMPRWLEILNKELQESESGFFLKKMSIADLELHNTLNSIKSGRLQGIPSDLADKYAALTKLQDQINQIPKVQEWNQQHNQI